MVFDSGWEWGYWMSDIITTRAAWNPRMDFEDETQAFVQGLQPFIRLLPKQVALTITQIIVDLVNAELELLIYGRVNGQESADLEKLSGFAYLSGDDTWVDLPRMLGLDFTQPDKVHMDETDDDLYAYVLPLLREMESTFGDLSTRMDQAYNAAIESDAQAGVLELVEEIRDAMQMLAYRAKHVRMMYESRSPDTSAEDQSQLWSSGRSLLAEVQQIVVAREAKYRVPWQRIADWHLTPTTYRYGYIWSVHSLYFW